MQRLANEARSCTLPWWVKLRIYVVTTEAGKADCCITLCTTSASLAATIPYIIASRRNNEAAT